MHNFQKFLFKCRSFPCESLQLNNPVIAVSPFISTFEENKILPDIDRRSERVNVCFSRKSIQIINQFHNVHSIEKASV